MRCRWCGLVYLKNDVTFYAVKWGCNHTLHPDWKKVGR